jgi:light-regulated signal transduction histidine kinase (bacteriophytochrome)
MRNFIICATGDKENSGSPQSDQQRRRHAVQQYPNFPDTLTGGSVTISARLLQQSVQIAIADSGEGISPQQLPHIFSSFSRTDKARDRGGTGLGLAIVKAIIEAHHSVTAKSDGLGKGSTFLLELPLGDDISHVHRGFPTAAPT